VVEAAGIWGIIERSLFRDESEGFRQRFQSGLLVDQLEWMCG
jgi:hypothetical protein